VTITKAYRSGGMLIQHYDYEVRNRRGPIYRGDTYFGFFGKDALANQVGIRDPAIGPVDRTGADSFDYPTESPYPGPMLRMIDRVEAYRRDGGPSGLGAIEGTSLVRPDAWFFKAHFHQDPVVPGSLGLESFLQLLKVAAADRWGDAACSLALGETHRWSYRGQVIPSNREVTTRAIVNAVDDDRRRLVADGLLSVDGRAIYQMDGFAVEVDGGSR